MSKKAIVLISIAVVLTISIICFFRLTTVGRSIINRWSYSLQKTDDRTLYEKRKEVEDTCRSMIASYNSDKMTYQQYKDSDNAEKQSWAEQAKMRANKTASSYNEFVLKNTFVWKDNVPEDIYMNLPYITE